MRSFFRVGILLLLNVAVQRTEAKNLKIAFGNGRPPYVFQEQGKWKGIEVEVVGEIFRRLGQKYTFDNMSPLRLEAEAKHGNSYDVVVGVPLASDGAVFYSEPYVYFQNYAIALKKKKVAVKNIKDLQRYRIGTWVNAWKDLGPAFRSTYSPKANGDFSTGYKEFVKQEEQSEAFWSEKIDVIIIDRYVFGWFRMVQAAKVDTAKDIEVFRLFSEKMASHVAFHDEKLRDSFNRELAKLHESGEYERIVRSYVGESLAALLTSKNIR
ncbi:transporter substrate-binding domain-containing protein [Bdellovibrio sp. 22V]|uniref:substrate-binding periplasmic protein n=1 Tax=Bdellovibrio TaxID=958 RepID=UPI002543E753|nr:transporter substrate-binding domain-containing protein [Bdellovibrio sp. 22V]WII70833.1 transporter substrate-binding domain-containing protein [Bdellovibrio sp. 22V]